jgi:predicted DNA-binding protein (MmcQ/YjbR family)
MTVTVADLLAYSLGKPGAFEDDPWGGDIVAKVGGKVFVFFGDPENGTAIGLKCGRNRDEADEWLARYPEDAKASGYIGRFGWNSLTVGGAIPDDELIEAVDASYLQIASKLPKKDRPAGYDRA